MALAHDLGHTPFGHTGEDAMERLMAPYGGFDHNAQALRIVTRLERHYADFDGLNLTWETLEGIAKHNGPVTGPNADAKHAGPLPYALAEVNALWDWTAPTPVPAQVAPCHDVAKPPDLHDGLARACHRDDLMELRSPRPRRN